MSLTIEKIGRRIEELATLRYRETLVITELYIKRIDVEQEGEIALRQGDRWGEHDVIYSARLSIAIPGHWQKRTLALRLDFSVPPTGWSIATIEGLLFLDEQPFHAIDRYHREIFLPPALTQRDRLDARLQIWSGLDEVEHSAHCFELRLVDEATEQLYQKMTLLYDACKQFAETTTTYHSLERALNDACNLLDFRCPRSDAFYTSTHEALLLLDRHIDMLRVYETAWQPRARVTGHAHIDVAWLWRLRHTRLKAAHTFSTALYHMDRYPFFTFTQSQPQLYAFVQQDYPELFERIKQKVQNGQWEPEGAMWVEADTNIPAGESLVRQFLFGQRYFKQEFGRYSRVLWLPDVFGYSAALPQLIKGAGADYFVTTKISWNDTNRIPMDTFWWQGIDGTRVLSYFITAQHEGERWSTYNAELKPSTLARGWKEYRQQGANNEILVAYGWGDGGGGPTREMIEAIEQLSTPISQELPVVAAGGVADFMQRLETRLGQGRKIPVWVGELYLEYHRGTYTSQARVKQANRFAERDLHNAEWLASLARILVDHDYPQTEFEQAWKPFLTNQFHDILPGSAIGPVYVDALETYARIQETTEHIIEEGKRALVEAIEAHEGTLVVFNSAGWRRAGIINIARDLPVPPGLARQRLADGGTLVRVQDVPALGYALFVGEEQEQRESSSLRAAPYLLENRFYRIELDAHGHIVQLWDKQAENGVGRAVIPAGQHANVFQLFEDKPINFDAWDIDTFYEEKLWELDDPQEITVVETGP